MVAKDFGTITPTPEQLDKLKRLTPEQIAVMREDAVHRANPHDADHYAGLFVAGDVIGYNEPVWRLLNHLEAAYRQLDRLTAGTPPGSSG